MADRHLERVLQGSATVVQLPPRRQASGWDLRRRVAAVALAAALVLAPATIASAAALPGQAMYPFKLAIEQLRIASVQWSPSREAGERTRVADERLGEVQDLIDLRMFTQLPNALTALGKAVAAAQVAVEEAAKEGEPVSGVAARLDLVEAAGGQVVQRVAVAAENGSVALPEGTRQAIQAAVAQAQDVLPPPDRTPTAGTPTPTTSPVPARPTPGRTRPAPRPRRPRPRSRRPPSRRRLPRRRRRPPIRPPPIRRPPRARPRRGRPPAATAGAAERTPADDVPPTTLEVPAP